MKSKYRGYTLVELLVTMVILIIVLVGGTTIYYRSFRSSGLSDVQAIVSSGLRSLEEIFDRSLRFGLILRVVNDGEEKLRSDCLSAGENGVNGESLVVRDSNGGDIIYSLNTDGFVSSNSGVMVSNSDIFVSELKFTWYCRSGVNDRINLTIEATASGSRGENSFNRLIKDIDMLNSGVN